MTDIALLESMMIMHVLHAKKCDSIPVDKSFQLSLSSSFYCSIIIISALNRSLYVSRKNNSK